VGNLAGLNKRGCYVAIYKITDEMLEVDHVVASMKKNGVTKLPCCIHKNGTVVGKSAIIDRYETMLVDPPKETPPKGTLRREPPKGEPTMEEYVKNIVTSDDNEEDERTGESMVDVRGLDELAKRYAHGPKPKKAAKMAPKRIASDIDDGDDDIFKAYAESS
jgi:hypothetical protein